MDEVRRDGDGELCGYVRRNDDEDGRWQAMTVFRGVLGAFDDEDAAHGHVLAEGLVAVADRWTLVDRDAAPGDQTEQIVCIQQMSPDEVTLALGYSSLPGVPTLTLATDELGDGRWSLERRS